MHKKCSVKCYKNKRPITFIALQVCNFLNVYVQNISAFQWIFNPYGSNLHSHYATFGIPEEAGLNRQHKLQVKNIYNACVNINI